MTEISEQKTPAPAPTPHSWARVTMWMVIVFILVAGGVCTFRACRGPVELMQQAGQTLAKVAAAFNRGTITTSFISYATTISNTTYLQFATLKQMEVFTRTEEPSTAFGYIPLPDVVVEARAPVEYTYYLDFKAKWQFVLRENVIYVIAPPIRYNKPAVDASKLNYEVKKGYVKSSEALDNLKQSITGLVVLRAKENIHLVRETGRKQTSDFVEKWLSKSFADGKQYPVKVYFPDEPLPDGANEIKQPLN